MKQHWASVCAALDPAERFTTTPMYASHCSMVGAAMLAYRMWSRKCVGCGCITPHFSVALASRLCPDCHGNLDGVQRAVRRLSLMRAPSTQPASDDRGSAPVVCLQALRAHLFDSDVDAVSSSAVIVIADQKQIGDSAPSRSLQLLPPTTGVAESSIDFNIPGVQMVATAHVIASAEATGESLTPLELPAPVATPSADSTAIDDSESSDTELAADEVDAANPNPASESPLRPCSLSQHHGASAKCYILHCNAAHGLGADRITHELSEDQLTAILTAIDAAGSVLLSSPHFFDVVPSCIVLSKLGVTRLQRQITFARGVNSLIESSSGHSSSPHSSRSAGTAAVGREAARGGGNASDQKCRNGMLSELQAEFQARYFAAKAIVVTSDLSKAVAASAHGATIALSGQHAPFDNRSKAIRLIGMNDSPYISYEPMQPKRRPYCWPRPQCGRETMELTGIQLRGGSGRSFDVSLPIDTVIKQHSGHFTLVSTPSLSHSKVPGSTSRSRYAAKAARLRTSRYLTAGAYIAGAPCELRNIRVEAGDGCGDGPGM